MKPPATGSQLPAKGSRLVTFAYFGQKLQLESMGTCPLEAGSRKLEAGGWNLEAIP